MAEIAVHCTNGVKEVVRELFPVFEQTSGSKLMVTYGATAALVQSIREGAEADVVIVTSEAIAQLAQLGKVVASSRTDLARSFIGVAVPAGTPPPEIGTVQALKTALLAARAVAYSRQGISGIYFPSVLERLGIAEAMRSKTVLTQGVPVGVVLARGEADLGIQQISELLPVSGIVVVGPLPAEVQKVTIFSAGLSTTARAADSTKALMQFLAASFVPDMLKR